MALIAGASGRAAPLSSGMEIRGRHVLVTGASRGIGEAVARRFALEGARLSLVARQDALLKQVAASIGASAFACDLSHPDTVKTLIGRVESENGPVDVLVNNAGIESVGYFPIAQEADVEAIYRVNLLTPVQLCRQVLPGMIDRGRGHIVNVSSLAGVGVFPGLAAYSSTKAGLSQFTAGLRADLKGLPIGTTLVELGPIPTDMLEDTRSYLPTDRSFRRFYRLGLLADVDRAQVAVDVVGAVQRDRRHLRHPKRAVLLAMLAEAPRRTVELVLSRVPPRA